MSKMEENGDVIHIWAVRGQWRPHRGEHLFAIFDELPINQLLKQGQWERLRVEMFSATQVRDVDSGVDLIPVRVHVHDCPVTDPVAIHRRLAATRAAEDCFLLESPEGPGVDRTVAVVGWGRLAELRVVGRTLRLWAVPGLLDRLSDVVSAVLGEPGSAAELACWPIGASEEIWAALRAAQRAFAVDTAEPDTGFAFGFLAAFAYEAAWDMEELPDNHLDQDVPRCVLTLFANTIQFNLDNGSARHLHAAGPLFDAVSGDCADNGALLAPIRDESRPLPEAPRPRAVRDNCDERRFVARVERCLRHIAIGDAYQIQIGHRIDVDTELTPDQMYARLRHRNPSPYMYLMPWAARTIIGASPELLFRISGSTITMRPIAGTARRAAAPEDDEARVSELRDSPKEQAEHVMLVDLCRNDIGRLCVPGTLSVDSMMRVETYGAVHHLVSTVSGEMAGGTDFWSALRATFPAGTMTGAPKLRAMELINEVEQDPRGIYAGAVGLIDVRGFAVLALCIRTAVHDNGTYSTQASAGVVADSDPGAEWRETLTKLRATYWALTGEELTGEQLTGES